MNYPTIPADTRVELYESNGGHLLVVAEGVGACEMTQHDADQTFAADAAGLLDGSWDLSDASESLVSLYDEERDAYYGIVVESNDGAIETTPADIAALDDYDGGACPVRWSLDDLDLVAVYDPSEAEPLTYYADDMGAAALGYTGVEVEA